jgi:SAM-dependent methyltransferase
MLTQSGAYSTTQVQRLNLGCGSVIHPAFINIDVIAAPGVLVHDLRSGIPFPDSSCELVYHSTMLSHLRPADALALTRECRRVLKPGGVLRIVTEDLEQMCRVYLDKISAAWAGEPLAGDDHDWMILELYDQATREYSGGRMAEFLRRKPLPNEAFIHSRIGEVGKGMIAAGRARVVDKPRPASDLRAIVRQARAKTRAFILEKLLGENGNEALEVGRFRLTSGQITYQMYDRYSLRQLFLAAGFSSVELRAPGESAYTTWGDIHLDVLPDGERVRPHTLIMEGIRAS